MLIDIIDHLDKVGKRQPSFIIMVEHLLQCSDPFIVETGTMRQEDNYEGDGMSTLLWHNVIKMMKKGSYISIDNDLAAVEFARIKVGCEGWYPSIIHSDSVKHLFRMTQNWWPDRKIDLLYLDSWDMEFPDRVPSFLHTMFEFMTIKPFLAKNALIVVDDNIKVLKDNEPEERMV